MERADLLQKSSAVALEEEAESGGARARPGGRPRPGATTANGPTAAAAATASDNKRDGEEVTQLGVKKQRTENGMVIGVDQELADIFARLKGSDDRKRMLKSWALTTVSNFEMKDLNYYLQSIKKAVEEAKRTKMANQQSNAADQAQAGGEAGLAAAPEGGDKPGLTGSFYPLNNLQPEGTEKKEQDEKVFKRARAEKRSPDEEQQYQDLLHSLSEAPVIKSGALDEIRFEEVLNEAMRLAKKLKDWFQVWSHCNIKTPENCVEATVYLANKLCLEKEEEEVADILGHLMKEKEISPKCMEEAIGKFHEKTSGRDITLILAHLLVFIYPTQKGDFGWSRVGWGFGQWWPQCKKYTKILPEPLEALKIVVNKLLEYKADFGPEKQEKMLVRAAELAGGRAEACDALGITGDDTVKPSPSPLSNED